MSLDKSILHGKEKRKQYYGDKAIDKSCRNHGSDDWSRANREYHTNREDERTRIELDEYNKGEEDMEQLLTDLRKKLKEVEARRFYHEMKDHWDAADFDYSRTLDMQISQIEENIKRLEEELEK